MPSKMARVYHLALDKDKCTFTQKKLGESSWTASLAILRLATVDPILAPPRQSSKSSMLRLIKRRHRSRLLATYIMMALVPSLRALCSAGMRNKIPPRQTSEEIATQLSDVPLRGLSVVFQVHRRHRFSWPISRRKRDRVETVSLSSLSNRRNRHCCRGLRVCSLSGGNDFGCDDFNPVDMCSYCADMCCGLECAADAHCTVATDGEHPTDVAGEWP